jgi:hypothetical protein
MSDFYKGLNKYITEHKKMRKGQAVFNYTFSKYKELTEKIVGTDLDCFYDDNRINSFLTYIEENKNGT